MRVIYNETKGEVQSVSHMKVRLGVENPVAPLAILRLY